MMRSRRRRTHDSLGLLALILILALALGGALVSFAHAQVTPGANFPLNGCVEGSPVMWVNEHEDAKVKLAWKKERR